MIHVGCEGFRDQHSTAELATLLPSACREPASAASLSTANSLRRVAFRIPPRIDFGLEIDVGLDAQGPDFGHHASINLIHDLFSKVKGPVSTLELKLA